MNKVNAILLCLTFMFSSMYATNTIALGGQNTHAKSEPAILAQNPNAAVTTLMPLDTPTPTPTVIPGDISSLADDELLKQYNAIRTEMEARGLVALIDLSSGDSGEGVLFLQRLLAQNGYYASDPTGKYDKATVKSVKAAQAAYGEKASGKASITFQQALVDGAVPSPTPSPTPKPTKTPRPTRTPKPTATPYVEPDVPLEITAVRIFYNSIGTPEICISVKNISKEKSVVAFTFSTQCYDAFGNVLKAHGFGDSISSWLWQEKTLKPGKKWSSNNLYWTLYGYEAAYKIEIWLDSVRTSDGNTITIPYSKRSNDIWVWTKY